MGSYFTTEAERKAVQAITDRRNECLMWGCKPVERTPEQQYRDHLKWAWIKLPNGERELTWVHNENMKAYARDGYDIKAPLEELLYTEFIRWATTFDL